MTVQEERFNLTASRIVNMVQRSDEYLPPYESDTRKRDKALQVMWRSESLLSGVLSASVARDKNRGWNLSGGVRLVSKYAKKLHFIHNNMGWRNFVSMNSTNWYTSNFGFLSEIEFEDGIPSNMLSMDSTRLKLTSNPKEPVIYYPRTGARKILTRNRFIHANSMPSTEEDMNYAGFCAIEKSLLFTRLMIGLHYHQLEKLGVAPPKGVLMGTGISRTEWAEAVRSFEEEKANDGTASYDGVMGLFTKDPNAKLSLIGLSELPDNFNLQMWLDNIMKAYSLAFGVPVYTFWTPESGTFGRGKEINEMRKNNTYMGELEFALAFQEQIQTYFLPETLMFDFDMRDDDAKEQQWNIKQSKINQVIQLVQSGLIDIEQGKHLLAEEGVIPREWSSIENNDVIANDLQEIRERARANFSIRKSSKMFPSEPIVTYTWHNPLNSPENKIIISNQDSLYNYDFPYGSVRVLWNDYDDLTKKRVF